MNFSAEYFLRYKSLPVLFECTSNEETEMIVVIPCYDDDFIFETLQSLEETNPSDGKVEVIVIVNSGVSAPNDIIENNRNIFAELKKRSENNFYKRFLLLPKNIENIPKKKAGVGFARKAGMDEAVRRFDKLNKPNGIIISLDADTLIDKDYLYTIEKAFKLNPKNGVFCLQFQHYFDLKHYSEEEIKAGSLYEIYLRYYRLALCTTGFPYSFHTVGSCFAVTAATYIKAGGMPCRQGGEDFYFLHKIAPMTTVGEIKEILVFPAPRISLRVPFGTGPSIANIIKSNEYRVYNFELFLILKRFFDCFEDLDFTNIPNEVVNFVGKDTLEKTILECKQNTKDKKNFTKRLFSKFDAFFVVKLLNSFDKNSDYPPKDILESAEELLKYYDRYINNSVYNSILELDCNISAL
jgi:hypothetical protein